MKLFKTVGDFFALDIGTTAVRVLQLSRSGANWNLVHYATAPVDIRVSTSDAPEDQKKLGEIITSAIGQSGIRTRDVVLGIPSNKMFATVVDLPDMSGAELASTIKYQAEQYVPMGLDEAKIDWAVVGKSQKDQSMNEVLLASVPNSFTESRLDLVESLGLNVVAVEPESLALVRALLPANTQDARLILEVGDFASDLVMTMGDGPRLIRSIPTGFQTFLKASAQNLNIQQQQAQQFLLKFGIMPDKLEGQILRSVESTVDQYIAEVAKSVKFFQTKYPSVNVSAVHLSGYGSMIPGFAEHVAEQIGIPAQPTSPWQRVTVSANDQTNLQPMSAQFAVAIGLAERIAE